MFMNYPKVLVVANNSFSLTNSNGRTLGNFFIGWPKECLAQFCISTDGPNYGLCDNYYCVTDKSMLDACLHFRKPRREELHPEGKVSRNMQSPRRIRKTAFHALIRHFVWMSGKWDSEEFNQWLRDFGPDIVLLQSGDSAFMLDIALKVAKKQRIPLMVFNTEGYYFFKHNYMFRGKGDFLFFPLYQALYKRKFRKLMRHAKFTIYGNSFLKRDYDKEFGENSMVLYTGSPLNFDDTPFNQAHPRFSYLGNLSFDRPAALMEVGEMLQSINKEYCLDVYGKASQATIEKFGKSKGVRYKGFVSYEKVVEIMKQSDVLFHVEGQDKRMEESLRYGFSTKIADSLASGKSFILYSSPDIACAYYLRETGAGWLATSKEELKKGLEEVIFDEKSRIDRLSVTREVVMKNHSIKKNSELFYKCIQSVVGKC